MAWKGIKHRDAATTVGEEVDSTEWADEEIHELANGTSLPGTASDGDFFFKTDEHRLYIWKEE